MHTKSLFSACLVGQAAIAAAQITAAESGSASSFKSLPPSPTSSGVCELHGNDWHCHATSSIHPGSASVSTVDTVSASATAKSCVPHNDHWHCPSGVSKPATPPAQTPSGTKSSGAASVATSAGAASSATSQARAGGGPAVSAGSLGVAVVASLAGAFLFGAAMV
ncbi:hypothetical protein E4U42_006919 [Claviceps africana]|uniref:Uncharacterized protein n=1 Tax=Claviceps africana TaxID=83212 RepID=A0A8K0J2F0_9HYPO|nr:hypothetical protein E4U42_006919 [Claviceps africana]